MSNEIEDRTESTIPYCDEGFLNIISKVKTERTDENEKKYQYYLSRAIPELTADDLLKDFSEEERAYKIVDLNNSCVYDVRKEEDI